MDENRDMPALPAKLPRRGEKLTSAQLRKQGLMHPEHQYAKTRNKWEILFLRTDEKRTLGMLGRTGGLSTVTGNRRRYLVVGISGTPPTKTGAKRKRPIKIDLWRRLG